MKIRPWVAIVCFELCHPVRAQLHAQRTSGTAVVAGVASASTHAPIAGAEFWIRETGQMAKSDWLGEARIAKVRTGKHRVRVRAIGYAPIEVDLLFSGDTIGPVFFLQPAAQSLDTVRVEGDRPAEMNGSYATAFDARRRAGIGRFLTRQELDRSHNLDFDLVARAHFPGVSSVRSPDGELRLVASSGGADGGVAGCVVRVYFDDMKLPDNDLTMVRTWDLGGAEFYSGASQPPQYKTGANAACPLLLLWSKR